MESSNDDDNRLVIRTISQHIRWANPEEVERNVCCCRYTGSKAHFTGVSDDLVQAVRSSELEGPVGDFP